MIRKNSLKEVISILKNGGVGVLETDTLYGLVGSVFNKKTILRIYHLKKRDLKKPFIILINDLNDLKKFQVKIDKRQKNFLKRIWPGEFSVIFKCPFKKFFYLHRGRESLAFRIPAKRNLRKILKEVGPLVAPSANLEGKKPATTLKEAYFYFKDKVDFYYGQKDLKNRPSLLIEIKR